MMTAEVHHSTCSTREGNWEFYPRQCIAPNEPIMTTSKIIRSTLGKSLCNRKSKMSGKSQIERAKGGYEKP